MNRLTRLRRATLAAAVAMAVAAPAASAACPDRVFDTVFSPWDDFAPYTLAPNGDLETGLEGWTLTGHARLISDNPKRIAAQAGDLNSLELPPGSSATSPPVCVASGYPSARLFGYTVSRDPESGSTLKIEVLYADDARGGQQAKKLGSAPDQLAWNATRKVSLAQGQLNVKPASDGNTYIRFRFTPLYRTTWRIDDLYVDPRFRL